MIVFISNWVFQGEDSKKYEAGQEGKFSKELEDYLVKEKIAVKKGKDENV